MEVMGWGIIQEVLQVGTWATEVQRVQEPIGSAPWTGGQTLRHIRLLVLWTVHKPRWDVLLRGVSQVEMLATVVQLLRNQPSGSAAMTSWAGKQDFASQSHC
jgi:hypothetical protein